MCKLRMAFLYPIENERRDNKAKCWILGDPERVYFTSGVSSSRPTLYKVFLKAWLET
jgi:hypothetical protein